MFAQRNFFIAREELPRGRNPFYFLNFRVTLRTRNRLTQWNISCVLLWRSPQDWLLREWLATDRGTTNSDGGNTNCCTEGRYEDKPIEEKDKEINWR
jgi:hypothetical protein